MGSLRKLPHAPVRLLVTSVSSDGRRLFLGAFKNSLN